MTADYRIALTGTPVENHVGDLWAIGQFLNPGLLGRAAAFRRDFFTPIQRHQDVEAMARLKKLTGPFLLRRLKTDPTVVRDLPAKIETTEFCTLTREQASLCAAVVAELDKNIAHVRDRGPPPVRAGGRAGRARAQQGGHDADIRRTGQRALRESRVSDRLTARSYSTAPACEPVARASVSRSRQRRGYQPVHGMKQS